VLSAIVTEIPPTLEPVTEDAFELVAASDPPRELTAARVAALFGSEPRRAIVD
jgi:hypothetical protein